MVLDRSAMLEVPMHCAMPMLLIGSTRPPKQIYQALIAAELTAVIGTEPP